MEYLSGSLLQRIRAEDTLPTSGEAASQRENGDKHAAITVSFLITRSWMDPIRDEDGGGEQEASTAVG